LKTLFKPPFGFEVFKEVLDMELFESILQSVKKSLADGVEPPPHVVLERAGKPIAAVGMVISDQLSKMLTFNVALPQIIMAHRPDTCIFVLPSRVKIPDMETGEIVSAEDVVVIYEVDAIKLRAVIVAKRGGKVVSEELDEENTRAFLLEPIQAVMKKIWADVI